MNHNEMLGRTGKDKITGFVGIITGYCVYLYGCTQFVLTSKIDKDGESFIHWFDDGRIVTVGKNRILPAEVIIDKNGGERDDHPF